MLKEGAAGGQGSPILLQTGNPRAPGTVLLGNSAQIEGSQQGPACRGLFALAAAGSGTCSGGEAVSLGSKHLTA